MGVLCASPLSLLILSLGVLNSTLSNIVKVILTHIAFECGVVDPYVDSLIVLVKQWSSFPMMVK